MLLQMTSCSSGLQSAAQRDTAALTSKDSELASNSSSQLLHSAATKQCHTSIAIASVQIQIADVSVRRGFQVCLILGSVLIVQNQWSEQLQAEAALWS